MYHENQRRVVRASVSGRKLPGSPEGLPVTLGFRSEAGEVEVAEGRIGQELCGRGSNYGARANVVNDGTGEACV